jgi:hypothetical protein
VRSVSIHRSNLHNQGLDCYDEVTAVVGIVRPSPASSVELIRGNVRGLIIPKITIGPLPSGHQLNVEVQVTRRSGRNAFETIKATFTFASRYETDWQNNVPDPCYSAWTEVDVRV